MASGAYRGGCIPYGHGQGYDSQNLDTPMGFFAPLNGVGAWFVPFQGFMHAFVPLVQIFQVTQSSGNPQDYVTALENDGWTCHVDTWDSCPFPFNVTITRFARFSRLNMRTLDEVQPNEPQAFPGEASLPMAHGHFTGSKPSNLGPVTTYPALEESNVSAPNFETRGEAEILGRNDQVLTMSSQGSHQAPMSPTSSPSQSGNANFLWPHGSVAKERAVASNMITTFWPPQFPVSALLEDENLSCMENVTAHAQNRGINHSSQALPQGRDDETGVGGSLGVSWQSHRTRNNIGNSERPSVNAAVQGQGLIQNPVAPSLAPTSQDPRISLTSGDSSIIPEAGLRFTPVHTQPGPYRSVEGLQMSSPSIPRQRGKNEQSRRHPLNRRIRIHRRGEPTGDNAQVRDQPLSRPRKGRILKELTPGERIAKAAKRKKGVCVDCRNRKVRCEHVDIASSSSPNSTTESSITVRGIHLTAACPSANGGRQPLAPVPMVADEPACSPSGLTSTRGVLITLRPSSPLTQSPSPSAQLDGVGAWLWASPAPANAATT